MGEAAALRMALDLVHVPSRVRYLRSLPLPEGVPLLLRIAASDERAGELAVELTGRSVERLREAAFFFIEQILFAPNADSYRVLGADPGATAAELRRNMALLQRWLHPDVQHHDNRAVFARRVAVAWNDLKTPARRAAYDRERQEVARGEPDRGSSRGGAALCNGRSVGGRRRSLWRRALRLLFAPRWS